MCDMESIFSENVFLEFLLLFFSFLWWSLFLLLKDNNSSAMPLSSLHPWRKIGVILEKHRVKY